MTSVDRLRVPFVHRLRRSDRGEIVCGARSSIASCAARSSRSLVAGGLLLALAAPALHLHIVGARHRHVPRRTSRRSRRTTSCRKAFPGEPNSAQVLVKTDDAHNPAVKRAIADLSAQSDRDWAVRHPDRRRHIRTTARSRSSRSRCTASGVDATSLDGVARALRRAVVPATVGRIDGADVGVTGTTASAQGLERPDDARCAVRVRVRARVRILADAADVPFGRDRDQGRRCSTCSRSPRRTAPSRSCSRTAGDNRAGSALEQRRRGDRRRRRRCPRPVSHRSWS